MATRTRPRFRFARWIRSVVTVFAVAYPIALIAAALTLRFVGERWWVSDVGLYLPAAGFALPLLFIVPATYVVKEWWLLRLQAVSAVVVVFPLMGFVLPWHVGFDRSKPTMRVLSFNVNAGRGGVEAVMEEVDRFSPDVVVLQEIHGSSRPVFERLLRERYPAVEVRGQFATATRYPFSSSNGSPATATAAATAGGELPIPFLRTVLDAPLGRIVLYNMHTTSPRGPLYALRGPRGIAREILSRRVFRGTEAEPLENNADMRASEVRAVLDAASRETDPVIVAGDTNLPHLSPVLHEVLAAYRDGFSTASWGFGYTFPNDKKFPWMRIDRILANDPLRFVRFQVGQSRVSDHRCVVGDLQGL